MTCRLRALGTTAWILILAGAATRTSAAPAMPFDTEKYVGAWVTFWNTYDLSQLDELFLNDGRLTYFSSEKEGLIKGIEAVREHHRGFGFVEGGKQPENELWVEELNTETYGTTAIVIGLWYFGERSQDSADIQRGPFTMVWVLDGERFRLAHLQFAN